jgi:hypothetical protein
MCDYEICLPSKLTAKSGYRLFHKRNHRCNIGKSGLSETDLKNVLETLPDGDPMIVDKFIYHDCGGYSDLENFWLQRCLTDEEDASDYEITQIVEWLTDLSCCESDQSDRGDRGSRWFHVCLFNTNKNKYYFRSLCRIIHEDPGMSEYLRKNKCLNAKNINFYIDYSNMETCLQYWRRLKNIIS